MLEGKGVILEVARTVSRVLEASEIPGAVIGGVEVVLHGHVRTTMDVDVWVPDALTRIAGQLQQSGYAPLDLLEIQEILTVSLADLINLKLASGTKACFDRRILPM